MQPCLPAAQRSALPQTVEAGAGASLAADLYLSKRRQKISATPAMPELLTFHAARMDFLRLPTWPYQTQSLTLLLCPPIQLHHCYPVEPGRPPKGLVILVPSSAVRPPDKLSSICLPLATQGLTLSRVGGKGLNLTKLALAGFPVPAGFIVATDGYEVFVGRAGLTDLLAAEMSAIDTVDPAALAALSDGIRRRFQASEMPSEISEQIVAAYGTLGRPPIAVRSSATAEDLPGMSFAGQQDTFLNVIGDEALLRAVVNCWSSLWTARAIAYRARYGIDQSNVSLAVVVQEMVQSDTSGVLFTANPLSGRRTETVIDATFGLGEALVSGHVEPDHFIVDSDTDKIILRELGAKSTTIKGQAAGGVITESTDARREQAITDEQIIQLTELGRNVANYYGDPQDIEWAFLNGKLYLLQSRPITSLFPVPHSPQDTDRQVYISLGAIQGVLGPFTPLGLDMLRGMFAGIAQIFANDATLYDQALLYSAAERPWIKVTGALKSPIGRLVFGRVLPMVEPGAAQSIRDLVAEPQFQGAAVSRRSIAAAVPFILRVLRAARRAFLDPEAHVHFVQGDIEEHIASVTERTDKTSTLAERVELLEWISYNAQFPFLLPRLIPPIIVGYASLGLLSKIAYLLSHSDPEIQPEMALEITRSLPNNVTTEMDLQLWRLASRIRDDTAASGSFQAEDAETIASDFQAGTLPPTILRALEEFLNRYGMRGVAEIDIGRVRWRDQPVSIVRSLQSYLSIEDESRAPDRVFEKGKDDALKTINRLADSSTRVWGTPLAGRLVHFLAKRVRVLAGLRESPKFTMVRISGILRKALLESGQELKDCGVLEQPDDLFYMTVRELKTLAMGAPGDWKKLVRGRRLAEQNESRRQPIPRLLLSDGAAFYAGITSEAGADANILSGSGVSPGTAEGTVRVLFNPLEAGLEPGEILVCPGTDPSWTPLFLAAGGLVMEVGGMMTHGSVVAREYGIPAVAGVDQATERLQTGQRVRVDGSSGTIEILD